MCGVGAVVSRDAAATSAALAKQLKRRGPDLFAEQCVSVATESGVEIHLLAAVLAMRTPVTPQPQELTTTAFVAGDAGRSSWLAFNGEIYQIGDRCVTQGPDTPEVARIVSQALGQSVDAQTCSSRLMSMLLQLRGPWAIVVWDAARARIFFGRDPVGRRSLVTWRGQPEDDHAFGVASTAPVSAQNCEEVAPLGIYALDVNSLSASLDYQAALSLTPWEQDSPAEPTNVRKRPLTSPEKVAESALLQSAEKLTAALRDAVRLRVEFHREGALGVLFSGGLDCTVLAALAHEFLPQGEPIDLFSVCFQAPQHQSPDRRSAVESWRELQQAFPDRQWNLVCTNRCDSDILREERHILSLLEPRTTHMDFNIGAALWFAAQGSGMLACASEHDIAAGTSRDSLHASRLRELLGTSRPEKSASEKTGNGVKILEKEQQDCSLHCAGSRCRGGTHLKASCVHKACVTCCKMHQRAKPDAERCGSHKLSQDKDAARKRRRQLEFQDAAASLKSAGSQQPATLSKGENEAAQQEYTSPARILLSGLGADEQLGGYGRHRVSYTKGGWENLRSELETDTARLWTRNLGRDDRCISDRGKEVRHPYLDENVMEILASLPLEHVVDPRLPSGDGDKRLLRIVACQLGLPGVSGLAKRAIQFGTRIAQVSRAHAPGSNRSYDASAAYVIRSESV